MLGFVHPWWLIGLAGLSLPILIHFLTRARPRRIELPTFAMLMEAGAGRQAVHRLRTWIILLIRAALVGALVLVFARPLWSDSAAVAPGPGEVRRVVLIVDASMSMNASQAGVPIFTAARAQAAATLRRFAPGTQAAVVLMGAEPRAILPAMSGNLAALHESLTQAQPTDEAADPAAALALAARLLGGPGEVYVFSDFQRTNWDPVNLSAHPHLTLRLHPVADHDAENLAVTAVRSSPAEPVVGEAVALTATIFNSTPTSRRQTVHLNLPGVTDAADVEIKPYRSADVTFNFTLDTPGIAAGRVWIDADDLPADDVRYFTLAVHRALRVLLISDADDADPTAAAMFVRAALSPARSDTGIRIDHRLSQDVDRGALETADVFVLLSPTRLSGETVDIIARRVTDGAALMCLLDGPTAPPTLAALAGASKGVIAPPFMLGDPVAAPTGSIFRFGYVNTDGALSLFSSPEQGDLKSLEFSRHFAAPVQPDRREEILAEFPGDNAALALSPAGRGAAVFANFPIAPAATNTPGSPLFPPLLHELLRALRRGGAPVNNTPGKRWSIDLVDVPTSAADDHAAYRVIGPGEASLTPHVVARGRATRLALPPAARPGHYHVTLNGTPVGIGVVNVNPDESDTRSMDLAAVLRGPDPPRDVSVISDSARLAGAGQPTSLWPDFAAVGALLLAAEMALLGLWRRTPQRAAAATAASSSRQGGGS